MFSLTTRRLNSTRVIDSTDFVVWEASASDTANVSAFWNATGATPGAYTAKFEATKNKAKTTLSVRFNLTASSTELAPQDLRQARTYGHLEEASAYQLYRFQHDASCGAGFIIEVESTNAQDVDLYVTTGKATPASTFTEVRDSTAHVEWVDWELAVHGEYTVMVKHKSTGTSYELRRYTSDACGYNEPEVPPIRDQFIEIE